MKIKYKRTGQVRKVPSFRAKALVKAGIAVIVESEVSAVDVLGSAGTYLTRDMHADREGPGDSNRIFIQGQIDQRTASQVAADAARKQSFAQAGDKAAAKQEVKASKAAKALAESADIDITKITGTGEGGAITKPDVQAYIAAKEQG